MIVNEPLSICWLSIHVKQLSINMRLRNYFLTSPPESNFNPLNWTKAVLWPTQKVWSPQLLSQQVTLQYLGVFMGSDSTYIRISYTNHIIQQFTVHVPIEYLPYNKSRCGQGLVTFNYKVCGFVVRYKRAEYVFNRFQSPNFKIFIISSDFIQVVID